ncbi:MAG: ATP-binding protein [Solirubrobacterales bacterium]|nr:ATP-binding protein [Solirubrobacterales bacterium]
MSEDGVEPSQATVGLTLPARAENVTLVRHALAGLAAALDADESAVADLKTIVTEACMNVCTHAYDGEEGPLEVRAWGDQSSLTVRIRDQGAGIRPTADNGRKSLRLGLPLIAALTSDFEIKGGPGRGTEVRMSISLQPGADGALPTVAEPVASPTGTEIDVPAGQFVGPILSRVVSMTATRANFSIDRLSDAVLLSDALATNSPQDFDDGTARISIEQQAQEFMLRVGPLVKGSGQRFLERLMIPEIGASLEALADETEVESVDGHDYVRLRICAG